MRKVTGLIVCLVAFYAVPAKAFDIYELAAGAKLTLAKPKHVFSANLLDRAAPPVMAKRLIGNLQMDVAQEMAAGSGDVGPPPNAVLALILGIIPGFGIGRLGQLIPQLDLVLNCFFVGFLDDLGADDLADELNHSPLDDLLAHRERLVGVGNLPLAGGITAAAHPVQAVHAPRTRGSEAVNPQQRGEKQSQGRYRSSGAYRPRGRPSPPGAGVG